MKSSLSAVDWAAVTQDVAGQSAVHLDLDGTWPADVLGLPRLDLQSWGPPLRYITTRRIAEDFWQKIAGNLPRFVLYGSGDFHHLAGLLIRRIEGNPLTLVSFDNHPDWDIRPPYWSCGGWAARALRTDRVKRVSVWGCGNFELRWPARLFADRAAFSQGRTFEVNAWAERQPQSVKQRFNCMTRENWRRRFEQFAAGLAGSRVYITVDMDCLRREEAITNWENGLFTAEDVAWGIGQLRQTANVVGADVCGGYSPARYARFGQKLAGRWDHPKLPATDLEEAWRVNSAALRIIGEALAT